MEIEVHRPSSGLLEAYGRIPIVFTVRSRLDIDGLRRGEVPGPLGEIPVDPPFEKDYDTVGDGGPGRWAERWDLSRWGVLVARAGGRPVGGAVLALDTPDVEMLEGRRDLVVVWDLRVHPVHRRCGVGRALWGRAVAWARDRGVLTLRVETQDVNVPACRFYAGRGCHPQRIDPDAYPACPDETLVLWELDSAR